MSFQEIYRQIARAKFPVKSQCVFYNSNSIFDVFQGNGVIELWSDVEVNDGGWHEVRAQFNPSYMEVTVDGRKKSHRPELLDNRHIDLSGLLYFGGIEAIKRSRAVSQGTVIQNQDFRKLKS
jgi:hypothetical protein